MTKEEAIDLVRAAAKSARKSGEYANGYNSGEYIGGRSEGFALAIEAIEGTLVDGQWNNYGKPEPKLDLPTNPRQGTGLSAVNGLYKRMIIKGGGK